MDPSPRSIRTSSSPRRRSELDTSLRDSQVFGSFSVNDSIDMEQEFVVDTTALLSKCKASIDKLRSELEFERERSQSLTASVSSLDSQLKESRKEVSGLHQRIEELQTSRASSESKLAHYEERKSAKSRELEHIRAELDETRAQLSNASKDRFVRTKELNSLREALEKSQKELAASHSELVESQKLVKKVSEERDLAKRNCAESELQCEALKASLSQKDLETKSAEARLEKLTSHYNCLRVKFTELASSESLASTELSKQVSSATETIAGLIQDKERLSRSVSELSRRLTDVNGHLKDSIRLREESNDRIRRLTVALEVNRAANARAAALEFTASGQKSVPSRLSNSFLSQTMRSNSSYLVPSIHR